MKLCAFLVAVWAACPWASGQEAVLAVKGLPAPISLAVDAQGALFAGTGDGRVLRIVGRNVVQLLAQTGGVPVSMAFDANDDLYVADAREKKILKVTPWGAVSAATSERALLTGVRDERGNLYNVENGKVVVRSSRGEIATVYELPAGRASAVALGGLDLKTLFVADTSAGTIFRIKVPNRVARLPWENSSPIRITEPVDGAILNRHDGDQVTVRGVCPGAGPVRVNGTSIPLRGGQFETRIALAGREMKIVAESGGKRDSVTVFWDRDSFPRYRFSTDDNIRWLKDIAVNADRYNSIFDNPYMAFWREMHRKYGTKIHHNLYYETAGFNLSQMPVKFRAEWQQNGDWLRLTFHARANEPDRPYVHSSAEKIRQDYRLVTREIERFAGKELLSPFTTIHWGFLTRAAAQALRQEGVRGLVGYFESRDELPSVCYYLRLPQWLHLMGRDYWKDTREDIIFVRHDIVINTVPLDRIEQHLERVTADPHQSEVMELMIHEQYFYPDYVAYEPDYKERVEKAIAWVARRAYKPVFYKDGFLGAPGR